MPDTLDRLKPALAGRHTIDRKLGRGGMAAVYLATDLKHHRPVAIKVLRPELAAALGAGMLDSTAAYFDLVLDLTGVWWHEVRMRGLPYSSPTPASRRSIPSSTNQIVPRSTA